MQLLVSHPALDQLIMFQQNSPCPQVGRCRGGGEGCWGWGGGTIVQSLVTVTQHFMASQQNSPCPQVGVCAYMCDCVLIQIIQ